MTSNHEPDRIGHAPEGSGSSSQGLDADLLRCIFDLMPVMVSFWASDGTLRLANREWIRRLGWTPEELIASGQDILLATLPSADEQRRAREAILAAAGDWREFTPHGRTGEPIESTWSTIRLADGTRLAIGVDISERKRAEEKLVALADRLRELSARVASAREDEARRLSRELHDAVGSSLAALRWDLLSLEAELSARADDSQIAGWAKRLRTAIRSTDRLAADTQQLARELRPVLLDRFGLGPAVAELAREFTQRTQVLCDVHFDETHTCSPETSIALFRIVQEALNNIAQHAQASRVDIRLERRDGTVHLHVQDDGVGIARGACANPRALGILGMQERARAVGGAVNISPGDRRGTVVSVRVPDASAA